MKRLLLASLSWFPLRLSSFRRRHDQMRRAAGSAACDSWTSATCHIFFSQSLDGAAADSLLFFPGHTWADMHEAQIASGSVRECISKAYGSQICKGDNEMWNLLMHNFITIAIETMHL